MNPPQDAARDGSSPHVVMIVDNGVIGDSRVQKQATSMRERGWRVTLVGRRADRDEPRRTTIGGVPTRLVYVNTKAGLKRSKRQRSPLGSPLGYRTRERARRSDGLATARVTAAITRIDELKFAGRDRGIRGWVARGRLAGARARRRVVDRRLDRSTWRRPRQPGSGEARRRQASLFETLSIRSWSLLLGERAWQRLDPGIWDWERAYAPVLDRLKPDLIHANDHRMLAIGARHKLRAARHGRTVKLVWDAHELLEGLEVAPGVSPRWMPAQLSLEHHHARYADEVVTVSEPLARLLHDGHGLATMPSVVTNAPLMSGITQPERTLREVVGLSADASLLVYSGSLSRERSIDTVVRGMAHLPDAHLAVVVGRPDHPLLLEALAVAEELGVRERIHIAPYVPVDQIVPYLSSADVGVHPILHGPNTEIALATKYYEYAQARLPVVVSDVKVMAETTRRTGQGEVFRAGDPEDFARAAAKVLGDLDRYRGAFDDELMSQWTWEAQADVLDRVYRETMGR